MVDPREILLILRIFRVADDNVRRSCEGGLGLVGGVARFRGLSESAGGWVVAVS